MSKWGGILQTFILIFSLFTSIFLLYDIGSYKADMVRLNSEIVSLEKKLDVKAGNWLYHVERRINSTSQSQDEYVITIHERFRNVEDRLDILEHRKSKGDTKNPVNNQTNTNTQNIYIGRDYLPNSPDNKKREESE